MNPVFDFLNDTPNRVPMTDWFWTHDATKAGFQARSVVGGVFLRMLYDDGSVEEVVGPGRVVGGRASGRWPRANRRDCAGPVVRAGSGTRTMPLREAGPCTARLDGGPEGPPYGRQGLPRSVQ